MRHTLIALCAGAAALAGLAFALPAASAPAFVPAPAPATGEPVLLELFTSQGCSSCPPADRLAERLAAEPGLVVIARPVTYWDRLGWKDSLAREENTALQHAYAQAGLAGTNGVYTPQLVIDGRFGTVGSREQEVRRGVARHGGKGGAAIRVRDLGARGFAVGIDGAAEQPAELVLVAAKRSTAVAIGRGENGGRTVNYTNVLRKETRLADWNGGKTGLVIAPGQLQTAGADVHALVLREPDGGRVLAARWLDQ